MGVYLCVLNAFSLCAWCLVLWYRLMHSAGQLLHIIEVVLAVDLRRVSYERAISIAIAMALLTHARGEGRELTFLAPVTLFFTVMMR